MSEIISPASGGFAADADHTPSDEANMKAKSDLRLWLSEGDVKDGRRSRAKAARVLPAVKSEAGLPAAANADVDEALTTFIVEVVLGAAWYTRSAKQAYGRTWLYIALNCALVVLLPVGLMCLSTLSNYATLVPQISGVLTGVFALQKTLSGWFAQRQQYAAWYQAGSDLKSIYYGFIDTCLASPGASDAALVALLRDRTAKGRGVIESEKIAFYQHLALPRFDVLDMLTSSRASVTSMLTALAASQGAPNVVTVGTKALLPDGHDNSQTDQVGMVDLAGTEVLSGDPDDIPTSLLILPSENSQPQASLELAADRLVDGKAVFLQALIVAGLEADAGVSRTSDPSRVTEYLALLNYPYQDSKNVPTRYCAAGVSWAATRAYCDVSGLDYDPDAALPVLKRALPEVNRLYFRPSAGCKVVRDDARRRGSWMPRDADPLPGWLVLYHWHVAAGQDPSQLMPEHIGLVVEKIGDVLHTIEFNTTVDHKTGSQSDGGAVAYKNQRQLQNVVGYVRTYSPAADVIV